MTKTQLKALEEAGDFRLYAKMPKAAGDMPVDDLFANGDILNDEGEIVRRKTYREYLLILAENETHILAKLLEQNADTSFTKVLEDPERSKAIAVVGMANLYSHEGALKERDKMCPAEEM